jgi:hypothetical protein
MVSADDHSAGKIEEVARNWACALQSSGEYGATSRIVHVQRRQRAGRLLNLVRLTKIPSTQLEQVSTQTSCVDRTERPLSISSGYWHHPGCR